MARTQLRCGMVGFDLCQRIVRVCLAYLARREIRFSALAPPPFVRRSTARAAWLCGSSSEHGWAVRGSGCCTLWDALSRRAPLLRGVGTGLGHLAPCMQDAGTQVSAGAGAASSCPVGAWLCTP